MLHGIRNASADLNWTHIAVPLETTRLATWSSRAWTLSVHGAHCDRASGTSVASSCCRGTFGSAFAPPSKAWALASRIALPREEAAKVAVTTAS